VNHLKTIKTNTENSTPNMLRQNKKPVQMFLPPCPSLNNSGLNPGFTFDEFVVGRCNAFAYEVAMAVSEEDLSRYNPLYFYSDVGLGKSHIAHAIGNKVLKSRSNVAVRYITARDFAQDYILSVKNNNIDNFRSSYHRSKMDLFFIDDVHLFKNKTKTQMELRHVMDDLMSCGKQVVLSGFRPPASIPQIDNGLKSRFSSGLVIDIKRPDLKTRSKIVLNKAIKNGIHLPDNVIDFISNNIYSSIRELESAVMTLTAMCSLMKCDITIDLTKELLEGTLKKHQMITIDYILDFVAKNFNLSKERMISPSRKKEIIYPRHVAIFLCRRYTNEPLTNIGNAFCREHSSIIHSLETIEGKYTQNLKIKRDIDFLIDRLDCEAF